MLIEPLRVNDAGNIVLSDKPGMGYALDEDMLASTRTS
jgi:hypothetical protein